MNINCNVASDVDCETTAWVEYNDDPAGAVLDRVVADWFLVEVSSDLSDVGIT